MKARYRVFAVTLISVMFVLTLVYCGWRHGGLLRDGRKNEIERTAYREIVRNMGDRKSFLMIKREMKGVISPNIDVSEFYLLDNSDERIGRAKVLFHLISYMDREIQPWTHRAVDFPDENWTKQAIDGVWNPTDKMVYLVAVETCFGSLTLKVYKIDPSHAMGTYPLSYNRREPKEYPRSPVPIAKVEKLVLEDMTVCGIDDIRVILEKNTLVVCTETYSDRCEDVLKRTKPLYFRYRIGDRGWAQMLIREEELKGRE